MDPFLLDGIKFLCTGAIGLGGAWYKSRGLSHKVKVLEEQNHYQQSNMDNMQTTLLITQGKLIEYQDDLIRTKDQLTEAKIELEQVRAKQRVFELKAGEEDATKQALEKHNAELAARNAQLEGRVSELEALCVRQEEKITRQGQEIDHLKDQLQIGGIAAVVAINRTGTTDELKPKD